MSGAGQGSSNYLAAWRDAWNRFWFTPRAVDTLALTRILVGAMVLYTHAVWTLELPAFFSAKGMLPKEYRQMLVDGTNYAWSHFDWSDSTAWLWGSHAVALLVMLLFTLGAWTRWTGWLTYLFVVSYANRSIGAQFGLDQLNAMLCLYLALSHCGRKWSLDQWWSRGRKGSAGETPTVMNNIATRLIQIHMCIIYLFAGLGKLQGNYWWNGEAIWGALASYEYQTLDLTWLAHAMWLVNILTLATVVWEVGYPCLVWPRLTRPIMLAMAVAVHLGIGVAMGMMTFGLIMIYGNLAFVEPRTIRRWMARIVPTGAAAGRG